MYRQPRFLVHSPTGRTFCRHLPTEMRNRNLFLQRIGPVRSVPRRMLQQFLPQWPPVPGRGGRETTAACAPWASRAKRASTAIDYCGSQRLAGEFPVPVPTGIHWLPPAVRTKSTNAPPSRPASKAAPAPNWSNNFKCTCPPGTWICSFWSASLLTKWICWTEVRKGHPQPCLNNDNCINLLGVSSALARPPLTEIVARRPPTAASAIRGMNDGQCHDFGSGLNCNLWTSASVASTNSTPAPTASNRTGCVCPLGFSGPSCVTLDKDKIVDKPQVVRCPSNMTGSKPAKDPPASTGPSCNSPTTSVWPSTGGGDERHPLRKHADQDGPGHLIGRVLRGVPHWSPIDFAVQQRHLWAVSERNLPDQMSCQQCPPGFTTIRSGSATTEAPAGIFYFQGKHLQRPLPVRDLPARRPEEQLLALPIRFQAGVTLRSECSNTCSPARE